MAGKRPTVDVVMPFAGSSDALERAVSVLRGLEVRPGDTVVLADNRPTPAPAALTHGVALVPAAGTRSSYFARNRGVEHGRGDWILFLDADVEPLAADLIDRYFSTPPADETAVLVGRVRDEAPVDGQTQPATVRYAYLAAFFDHEGNVKDERRWAYGVTANCAVRRKAFESIGGFREDIRSGGDADLSFRLRDRGWRLEWRRDAAVSHRSRPTLRTFIQQNAKHGAGVEWVERHHPGFSPRNRWSGLMYWTTRRVIEGTVAAARGNRDDMLLGYLDAVRAWAFQLGRLLPNRARVSRPR